MPTEAGLVPPCSACAFFRKAGASLWGGDASLRRAQRSTLKVLSLCSDAQCLCEMRVPPHVWPVCVPEGLCLRTARTFFSGKKSGVSSG